MKSELSPRLLVGRGARPRRFWSSDEKRRMVAESFEPGASVSTVAQRYGVNANLLFTWRRQEAGAAAKGDAEPVKLLPVTLAEATAEAPTAAPIATPESIGRMEIVLPSGERIIVGADVDATALARVVRTLTRR
jgi:transposase